MTLSVERQLKKKLILKLANTFLLLQVVVKITFTNKTPLISCPPVYNVIFRRVQTELKMTQVGRHFYDPNKKVDIRQHK